MSCGIIALCPGQGAQKVGMGKAWYEKSAAARAVFDEADEALADTLGASLRDLCFQGPEEELNRTDISQPAIYTCSVACWRGLRENGLEGDLAAAAGLSLGEYTALHLAGVFDFVEGLRLVATRGRLMQDAAEAADSTMVAMMGDDADIESLCADAACDDVLVPANYNAPGQLVISGSTAACTRAAEAATERGLRAAPLSVAGAFHSPFMAPAAEGMRSAMEDVTLREPTIDVWSNVTASLHDRASLANRLVDQITNPVRWSQQCREMAGRYDGAWHEMAPGGVLRGLMRRIDRQVKVQSHDEP